MATTSTNPKPHAVMLPFPATGHVNPLLQLSKLLHSRGFHITFVNTDHHHRRLVRSKGPDSVRGLPDFRFETIPDGLPPNDVKQPTALVCDLMQRNGLAPFRALLQRLNSASDTPRVTCIVSDGVMTFAMQAARELGVPEAQFWTASAIGLMGYCQFAELVRRQIVPLKDESYKNNGYLETPLEWVPGTQGMRLKHIPSFAHTTDPQDIMLNYMIEQTLNMSQSSGVIVNSFEELEGDVLRALAPIYPRIFPIGPLFRLLSQEDGQKPDNQQVQPSLWVENDECIDWLDGREAGSVVYVNFGSVAMIKEGEVEELAWGLAGSGYDFLWVLRRDIMMGESPTLPEGFGDEVRGRGMIASWCHQDRVLSHPAVGLFVTHAGWNSLLESVGAGVPTLCWPFGGEQSTNALQVCTLWGNGMEIKQGSKTSEITSLVNEMMSGKRGFEMREKATEWKKKAEAATAPGGSSLCGLDKLIQEVLMQKM